MRLSLLAFRAAAKRDEGNEYVNTYSFNHRRCDRHGRFTHCSNCRPPQFRRCRSAGFRCRGHRRQRANTAGSLCGAASATSFACVLRAGRLWASTLELEPWMVQILSWDVWTVFQSQKRILPSRRWWLVLLRLKRGHTTLDKYVVGRPTWV